MRTAALAGIRAVVFDLDGTLMDSMPLVLKAFAHALAPYLPELDEAAIFQRLGGPPRRMFLELLGGDEARADDAMVRLEEFGFANSRLEQPFEGMKALLGDLKERGLKLAVWTGRDRFTTEIIFKEHGLGGFFETVVCGDDLPSHKPSPEGLREILRRLGVQSDETIYLGDADADVLGGNGAGVATLLIRHRRVVETAIDVRAWQVVDTPPQAYAVVRLALGLANDFQR